MKRTTIMLPDDLKRLVEREAALRGASLGEIVRMALQELLLPSKKAKSKKDSLFCDNFIYKGPVEKDISSNHDAYLY